MSLYISVGSLLVAFATAIYAYQQSKAAKQSVLKAEESIQQALEQNRNNALIILKEHFENELPRIKRMADHFEAPGTIQQRKSLDDEYLETQRKLHSVNAEIRKLYNHYVTPKECS